MSESSIKILADENISKFMVNFLHEIGAKSFCHCSKYQWDATPDEEWIPRAAKIKLVCITYDRKMLEVSEISQKILDHKVRFLFVSAKVSQYNKWDQTLWYLKNYRKIENYAESMVPGDIAFVSSRCNFKKVIIQKNNKRKF